MLRIKSTHTDRRGSASIHFEIVHLAAQGSSTLLAKRDDTCPVFVTGSDHEVRPFSIKVSHTKWNCWADQFRADCHEPTYNSNNKHYQQKKTHQSLSPQRTARSHATILKGRVSRRNQNRSARTGSQKPQLKQTLETQNPSPTTTLCGGDGGSLGVRREANATQVNTRGPSADNMCASVCFCIQTCLFVSERTCVSTQQMNAICLESIGLCACESVCVCVC